MRNWTTAVAAAAALSLLVSSCRLGPDYKRPEMNLPSTYRGVSATDQSLADKRYFEVYGDSVLNRYISQALDQNYTLLATLARIDQAKAGVTIQSSQWYPSLDVSASATEAKLSKNRFPNQTAEALGGLQGIFGLSAMLNWELDIFGRIARGTEAQRARLSGSYAGNRAAVLTLVANVAETYVTLREFDEIKEKLDSNLANRREYLALAKTLYDAGKTSELDYRQAEAELHRIEASIAPTIAAIEQTENALNVLLSLPPGTPVQRGMSIDELEVPEALPTGLPGSLLERRPDVQLAEYDLEASTAEVGVATAQQFPRVALTADVGLQSVSAGNLFDPASFAYQFAGNLLQPVFNAGRNAARVDAADAQAVQAEMAYKTSVLSALRDVNDAVTLIRNGKEQVRASQEGLSAVAEVLRLSQLRYRYGATPYLQVLDAQRSLLDAQRGYIGARANLYRSYVRFYKSLGGGWQK
ncbi:MAG: efflux transporter outer membrane subunit [Ignavibacteria bacterium]|jgi:multidrug efflux system outer membrane protein